MTIDELYKVFLQFPSVQTDTRKLKQGYIFFALKGPNFNGNTFAEKALEQGAALVVADEQLFQRNDKIVVMNDALETLQLLAKYHRRHFHIPFIAITGSNGKTTTKELVSTVLASTYKTYTTQGNLNNHVGVPLTILSIQPDAEMAVIEMGANHQGEIASYCEYTLPTHGIITNAGKAHLEGFGGVEGVKKGKGELFDYLRANEGTAFVMWDYDYLQTMSNGIEHIIKYGTHDADLNGKVIKSDPFLIVETDKGPKEIKTQLVGEHNFPNLLVAVTVAKHFKVENDSIKKAIEAYAPSNSRSQLIEKNGNKIILDAYNANPSSMKTAIENFARLEGENKILMLGGMMELGPESKQENEELIELIKQYNWKAVVLVGGDFLNIKHGFESFENSSEAAEWVKKQKLQDAFLLVKGSRSMQMEKVLEDKF